MLSGQPRRTLVLLTRAAHRRELARARRAATCRTVSESHLERIMLALSMRNKDSGCGWLVFVANLRKIKKSSYLASYLNMGCRGPPGGPRPTWRPTRFWRAGGLQGRV